MQQKPGMKGLKAAIEGLAGVVAVIAAFLGTPEVHGRTVVWIGHLIQRQYGAEFVEIAGFVWFVLVSCSTSSRGSELKSSSSWAGSTWPSAFFNLSSKGEMQWLSGKKSATFTAAKRQIGQGYWAGSSSSSLSSRLSLVKPSSSELILLRRTEGPPRGPFFFARKGMNHVFTIQ